MKRVVILLPMKGNSERVKNKNMKEFAGMPLYHAVVRELKKSRYKPTIVVNTDSDIIKKDISSNFSDIVVIDRPKDLIGDFVPMNDIIAHDIENVTADIYVQTHSTNPLMLASTLDSAIDYFITKHDDFDSLFTVTRLQTRLFDRNGIPINHNPAELIRTQDLDPIYEENSNFYLFTNNSFKSSSKRRIGLKPLMFEIDKIEAVDIDEPTDFIIAESLYKLLRKNFI